MTDGGLPVARAFGELRGPVGGRAVPRVGGGVHVTDVADGPGGRGERYGRLDAGTRQQIGDIEK